MLTYSKDGDAVLFTPSDNSRHTLQIIVSILNTARILQKSSN